MRTATSDMVAGELELSFPKLGFSVVCQSSPYMSHDSIKTDVATKTYIIKVKSSSRVSFDSRDQHTTVTCTEFNYVVAIGTPLKVASTPIRRDKPIWYVYTNFTKFHA